MNTTQVERTENRRPDEPTAVILLHPTGAPENGSDKVDLTIDQQRQLCRALARQVGLTVTGEGHFDEHPSSRNHDGFWVIQPERFIGDVLIHVSLACSVTPVLSALVIAQEAALDGRMAMQLIAVKADASLA